MGELAGVRRGVPLDAIHESRERPRHHRALLRLEHFRGRHHLHRASDLRGIGNRPDAPPKFTRVWHISLSRFHFHVCLNSSAAAFNSAVNSSLSDFSLPILASNWPLRVVKYSVNLFWNSLIRGTGT